MHKTKTDSESGKSLVELIGTLAIAGVLMVGVISAYRYVMNRIQTNALYDDINTRLILANEKKGRIFSTDLGEKSTYDLAIETLRGKPVAGYNKVQVHGVKSEICSLLLQKDWEKKWPRGVRLYVDGKVYQSGIFECPSTETSFAVSVRSAMATRDSQFPTPCSSDDGCTADEICTNGECLLASVACDPCQIPANGTCIDLPCPARSICDMNLNACVCEDGYAMENDACVLCSAATTEEGCGQCVNYEFDGSTCSEIVCNPCQVLTARGCENIPPEWASCRPGASTCECDNDYAVVDAEFVACQDITTAEGCDLCPNFIFEHGQCVEIVCDACQKLVSGSCVDAYPEGASCSSLASGCACEGGYTVESGEYVSCEAVTTEEACNRCDGYSFDNGQCMSTAPVCDACEDLIDGVCVARTCVEHATCDATQDACVCEGDYVMENGECVTCSSVTSAEACAQCSGYSFAIYGTQPGCYPVCLDGYWRTIDTVNGVDYACVACNLDSPKSPSNDAQIALCSYRFIGNNNDGTMPKSYYCGNPSLAMTFVGQGPYARTESCDACPNRYYNSNTKKCTCLDTHVVNSKCCGPEQIANADHTKCIRNCPTGMEYVSATDGCNCAQETCGCLDGNCTENPCTQVDYLVADGSQYINTEYVPTSNFKIDIETSLSNTSTNVYYNIFGSRTAASNADCFNMSFKLEGVLSLGYGIGTDKIETYLSASLGTNYHIVADKNTLTINGISKSLNGSLKNGTYNMYLFTNNQKNTISSNTLIGRIYYAKFYDGATLTRDFVPVTTQCGDGALYDKVTGRLFYNKGTGAFGTP